MPCFLWEALTSRSVPAGMQWAGIRSLQRPGLAESCCKPGSIAASSHKPHKTIIKMMF